MWEARLPSKLLKALHTCISKLFPISRGKVHRLIKIEAMVEPGVVSLWKGDNELTSALVKSIHLYSCLPELFGRQERHQLKEEVWLRLKQLGDSFSHCVFECMGILTGYTVPCLGSTKVLVIR